MTEKSAKKNSLSDLKLYGAPWYITVIGCIVVIAAAMAWSTGNRFLKHYDTDHCLWYSVF